MYRIEPPREEEPMKLEPSRPRNFAHRQLLIIQRQKGGAHRSRAEKRVKQKDWRREEW